MKKAPDLRDLRKYAPAAAALIALLAACAVFAPSGVKAAFRGSLESAFGSFGGPP